MYAGNENKLLPDCLFQLVTGFLLNNRRILCRNVRNVQIGLKCEYVQLGEIQFLEGKI